ATFSVAATDVDGDSLLYTWNFGDGNAQSGASVVHAYAAPGTYTARVTISDESTSIQSSVVVTVTVATDPRLIAHWKLNEATGTRASDSSGNDNHGTLVNGPVWSPGRLEGGLKCDGINDFVESPNKPSLNPAAQLTLSAWVNMAELNATSKAVIAKTSSLGAQYCLVILPKGRLRATVANSGVSGVTVLAPGRWYHLAVTYDGVALKLYVNGVLDSSVAKSGAMTDCGANVRVGQGTGTESLYFSGTLDDVRIYNQALTAGEINGLAFPAAAAASAVPVIIDLGTYSTGERLKLKLPLPETLTSSRKRFKLADGSLPRGLRHSNGRLSGVPSEKGTFQFTLSVSARGQSLLQAYVITIRTQE
ncbi:MAG TPA: LamG-like jellyroll fold domain-containing protein, partial [Planctomycetota bacterium]|nr:LamG-like jellyroll fold domain-containing protein [Planctomycetota bacterium]